MEFIIYNTTGAMTYRNGGYVDVIKNCNGFTAVNTGDEVVRINDNILYPGTIGTNLGDSITIGGNLGEIYKGLIKVEFAGGGSAPSVTIEQKFYPNIQTIV